MMPNSNSRSFSFCTAAMLFILRRATARGPVCCYSDTHGVQTSTAHTCSVARNVRERITAQEACSLAKGKNKAKNCAGVIPNPQLAA